MSSRFEKERQKAQQEKFQAILSGLLKDEDNKYCVDCDAKGPRWASWNLGIFLCIRCAGIHRNLGVHISKVKSVNLDTWTPEQVVMVMEIGNSRARAAYEANLPDNYRRPQTDSALESFIRAKYETKKYLAKEWVPPRPAVPKELLEDDKDKKKVKSKGSSGNLQLNSVPRSQTGTSVTETKPASKPVESKPVQTKVTTPQQPKAPPPTNSNTADLIGLVFAQSTPTEPTDAPVSPVHTSNNLLSDLNDFMGSGSSSGASQPSVQPGTNQVSNGNSDLNLFGEASGVADKSGEKVSAKDSIMALYGGQQKQQQFGVPGGVYMPQQQNVMPQQHSVMPQQQNVMPQQQNVGGQMYGMQMNNMQMPQQQGMYGQQMGMMGMPQQQGNMGMPANMGMPHAAMGMPQQQQGMRMPQGVPQGVPQGNMGMYGAQQQMQQNQYQQMQHQMNNMSLGQSGGVAGGMMTNGIPAGQGWGGQASGHTLSTNLWQ